MIEPVRAAVRDRARTVFWSDREPRLRAFWRVTVVLIATLSLVTLTQRRLSARVHPPYQGVVVGIGTVAVVLVVLAGTAVWVDRRPVQAYGFGIDSDWWGDLVAGASIGMILTGGTFGVGLAAGWITVDETFVAGPSSFGVGLFTGGIVFLLGSLWEETVFRGILTKNAAEGFGAYVSRRTAVVLAWIGISVLFGVLHVNQATGLALGYWILVGSLFGMAYVLTGELALPIGLHLTYNFGLNHVFGFGPALHGGETTTLLLPELHGPDVIVGIAGMLHVMFALVGYVLVLGWVWWRYGDVALKTELTEWSLRNA